MAEPAITPTTTEPAPAGNAPAQGGSGTPVTFTAEQQAVVDRVVKERLARAEEQHRTQLTELESKLKTPTTKPEPKAEATTAELQARLEFSEALQDLAVEVGPVTPDVRERLRVLYTVAKPPDRMAWLRQEVRVFGLGKPAGAVTPPAPVSTPSPFAAPVVPAAAGAAPAASVDLAGPLSLAQLAQPGIAQEIIRREGHDGMLKRLNAARQGSNGKGWSWAK